MMALGSFVPWGRRGREFQWVPPGSEDPVFSARTRKGEAGLEAQGLTCSTLWSGNSVLHLQGPHFYNKTSPN